MSLDIEIIKNIANLARIKVRDDELDHMAGELSVILSWVEQLNGVDTDGVVPLASVVDVTLPVRTDVVSDGDCHEKVLANAPDVEDGFYAVPKVVE
jgi:aspartyl-tRNA(Asn)/glutamyl-tRNA(Gln) amidotransferase subunit C